MTDLTRIAALAVLFGLGVPAQAATLIPAKGQTPEQIQADTTACQAEASKAAAPEAAQESQQQARGGRLRGAAVGAAAGAAAAEVRGNQYEVYDQIDSDVKEEYRRNEAKGAATAGAVIGGARQRQQRRTEAAQQESEQKQAAQTASTNAFNTCMAARGYTLAP